MSISPGTGAGLGSTRAGVTNAIAKASNATGASFQYMLSAAKIESNLNPGAAASTSSARGLYQFIEQTWLGTVKEAGAAFGFGNYADSIQKSASGRYSVSDPATKEKILNLRDDPAVSSAMAGVLTQSNSFKLTGALGRRPTDAELYIAHFMGVGGASKLITRAQDNPNQSAALLFPQAAAANRSIFYDRNGGARTASQVYGVLAGRYASAANSQATQTAMASFRQAPAISASSMVPVSVAANAATYLTSFPQLPVERVSSGAIVAAAQSQPPTAFRSIYQTGERTEAVSPLVRELWGNRNAAASQAPSASRVPEVNRPRPLDLFSDPTGLFS